MGLRFITFAVVLLALVPHILFAIVWPVCRIFGYRIPYGPFGWTAVGVSVVALAVMLYGMYIGRWRVQQTALEYSHESVPSSFRGYRIVHISDMHLYTFAAHSEKLQAIVDRINSLEPDLVCFTGDMVSLSTAECSQCGDILKGIKASDGVAAVLGNHDFFLYSLKDSTEREAAVAELCRFESETLGWRLLRNESFEIRRGGDKITVIGIDNINGKNQGFQTIAMGDLAKASEGTDGFRILLSHDPSYWEKGVVGATDIPLTLSGHTHAAQIKLFGWTPASWMFNQTSGRYDIQSQTLYVNVGLGCTAQMRVGADAEITLITLND